MAKNLASHGYAVMSLEANTSNFDNGFTDGGARVRSLITQANLELLWRWNNGAGPYVPGEPDHTVGTKLVGKLNFAEGIGLMGHSRGGDAVTDFIAYTRNLTPRVGLPALHARRRAGARAGQLHAGRRCRTAPTTRVLLPACDGDVSTLQGARFFENAKYPTITTPTAVDNFAKVQWYVQGTNHNFFNTVWTQDDASTTTDPACSRQQPATTARLTPADQRRVGGALMNSFFRRYVGKETAFDPIMTGEVTLPASAAPLTQRQGPRPGGQDLLRRARRAALRRAAAEPDPGPAARPGHGRHPDAVRRHAHHHDRERRPDLHQRPDELLRLQPERPRLAPGPDVPDGLPAVPRRARPTAPRATSSRSRGTRPAATCAPILGRAGAPVDVSKYGVLDLRAALNRADPRNPAGDGYTPNLVTQNFDVTLIDVTGKRVSTRAANWSTALQPSIGNQFRHIVLNGIRIPLTAFAGIDLTKVTAVEFGFGSPALGSIQLADVMFQETAAGRAGPERRRRRRRSRAGAGRPAVGRCRARSSTRRTVAGPGREDHARGPEGHVRRHGQADHEGRAGEVLAPASCSSRAPRPTPAAAPASRARSSRSPRPRARARRASSTPRACSASRSPLEGGDRDHAPRARPPGASTSPRRKLPRGTYTRAGVDLRQGRQPHQGAGDHAEGQVARADPGRGYAAPRIRASLGHGNRTHLARNGSDRARRRVRGVPARDGPEGHPGDARQPRGVPAAPRGGRGDALSGGVAVGERSAHRGVQRVQGPHGSPRAQGRGVPHPLRARGRAQHGRDEQLLRD